MRILFYLILIGIMVWLWSQIAASGNKIGDKRKSVFRIKRSKRSSSGDIWVQVYDSDSLEEVRMIQARLEEEEIDCFVYEQGRKDIHGNPLKGYGISVLKTSVSRAQNIISKIIA